MFRASLEWASPATTCGVELFLYPQKEGVRRRAFATRAEAQLAMFSYIEGFYNMHRARKRLDYVSPMSFVRIWKYEDYINFVPEFLLTPHCLFPLFSCE